MTSGLLSTVLASALSLGLLASSAQAEEKELTFQLNQPLVVYGSTAAETKVGGGATVKSKSTSLDAVPTNLEAIANFKGMHLHFYPANPNSSVFLGYDVITGLELGLGLALDQNIVDKPKNESSRETVSLYAYYTMPLGKTSLEFNPIYAMTTGRTEDAAGTKTETKGSNFSLTAYYACPIAGGFSYLTALAYAVDATEETVSKTKVTSSTLTVMPVGIRFDL